MTVKLEMFEIVWLQKVRRYPGTVTLDSHPVVKRLMANHLIFEPEINCLLSEDERCVNITHTGEKVLEQNLPYKCGATHIYDKNQLRLQF